MKMDSIYWSLVLVLVAAFTATQSSYAGETSCSHTEDMDQIKRFHITPKDNGGGRGKRAANTFSESFTAVATYDNTFDSGLSSAVAQQIKDNVIPKLLEFFESTLSVRPTPGPLVFDRGCNGQFYVSSDDPPYCVTTCDTTPMCGTATIPTEHLKVCRQCNGNQVFSFLNDCEEIGTTGAGVDSSFSLYISAVTTGSCPVSPGTGSTLAFAGACEMEDEYDRPVSGYINFCPNSFTTAQSDDYLLTVAKHELLHALGFSSGLYQWWRDENGDPRSPRNSNGRPTGTSTNTRRSVTYTDWSTANGVVSHTVSLLVTPNIVEEGRRHYNCPTLVGVQLEDQGGSGTIGSHWEARISRGEVMNGVISNDAVFSRLTFALLEDSGWYKVNYRNAQQLVWGRAGGCELAAGSCRGYIDSQEAMGESISPFCDYAQSPASQYRCNVRRTAVSNCNLVTFNSALPAQYRYFSASNQGGSFSSTDYCPYQRAFSNTVCTDTDNAESGLSNSFAETFGPGARCVEHGSTLWRVAQEGNGFIQPSQFPRAGCYNYTCSNGQVTIHILDQSYNCTTAGEEITISQTSNGVVYTGSIICPSCLEICYDDFVNCPEAAQIYSEFANIAATDPNSGVSSATPAPSSTPRNSIPTNGSDTRPLDGSGVSIITASLFTVLTGLIFSAFVI